MSELLPQRQPGESEASYWERVLDSENMPSDLPDEDLGERVELGDGLGRKTDLEEDLEDEGHFHSRMCPINLRTALLGPTIDQPNDRPVEDSLT